MAINTCASDVSCSVGAHLRANRPLLPSTLSVGLTCSAFVPAALLLVVSSGSERWFHSTSHSVSKS